MNLKEVWLQEFDFIKLHITLYSNNNSRLKHFINAL